jgi:hypothetical protein
MSGVKLISMQRLTKLKQGDELERIVKWKELEWDLTCRGRKMFPIIMPHKPPAPERSSANDWWNG